MELNNTTVKEMPEFQAGSKTHIVVYGRVGAGSLDLQLKTETGYKSVVRPIDDDMIDAEGGDGGVIPADAITGQMYKIINNGYTAVNVEVHTQTI